MNKISPDSFNVLKMLNEHASKMPLGLAMSLMKDNEEKLETLQKFEFVCLVFLKHFMKVTEQGFVPDSNLKNLIGLPDEVFVAYDIATKVHGGYSCAIDSPGVERRIEEIVNEYPVYLSTTGKDLKQRVKDKNNG